MTSVRPVMPSRSASLLPPSTWEWLTVSGIILLALALRFCYLERLAVEHFDEGVYASNFWFGDRGGCYPEQHLYAPPMLPALIEFEFELAGPGNALACVPNQLAGTVTVLLLWWLGRSWFGPVAGLVAACCCAVNEVHLLFSRAALTDALLGMWWVASLIALRRACLSGRWTQSVLAGYLVAMAWYTKYNGWMPLAITLAAVVARGILCRGIWPATRRALTSCAVASCVAGLTWIPWLWSLQSKGGYASVMANHRQYVVGPAGWLSSALRQFEQLTALTGRLSGFTVLAVCLVLSETIRRAQLKHLLSAPDQPLVKAPGDNAHVPARPSVRFDFFAASVSVGLSLLSPLCTYLLLSLQSLWVWLSAARRSTLQSEPPDQNPVHALAHDLGYWMLGGWFVGLLLATPLYQPYLRLTIPWLLATFVGTGLALQQVWDISRIAPGASVNRLRGLRSLHALVIVPAFGMWLLGGPALAVRGTESRLPFPDLQDFPAAARQVAAAILKATTSPDHEPESTRVPETVEQLPAAVYVFGEPGLLFQLRFAGLMNVGPIGALRFMDHQYSDRTKSVFLVVGHHAKRDPAFQQAFAERRRQLKLLGSWPWHLSPLVALDQPECQPSALGSNAIEATSIELYEVLPP